MIWQLLQKEEWPLSSNIPPEPATARKAAAARQ